jgi:ATP-dependent exoDNAse (exonuclease V) alpha subunit
MSYTSRSGGGSACSHAAYISGGIVKDERTGQTWDYSKKAHDVLYSEIIAPERSPEWVYDRDQLWNEVERFEDYIAEKRFKGHKDPIKNDKSLASKEKFLSSCKTSFKADFALPIEITDKTHLRDLARKIVRECYVDHGLVAQYAIHDMKGNPHLHIIATTRPLIEGSFSEKRFVIEREKLVEMRKQMADICNQYAQEKGYDYHLDHRSYKDQGIKLVATKHLGPNARHRLQDLSQNVQDNEEIRQKNIEILFTHPEEIIKVVASQKAVFTQVDLAKEIFKRVGGDEKLYAILKAKVDGLEIPSIAIIGKTLNDNSIYESKSIHFDKADYLRTIESFTAKLLSQEHTIYLGENVKGQAFYTSHEMKELETTLHKTLEVLKTKETSSIKEKYKLNSIEKIQKQEGITFSDEQRGALDHLLSNKAITVLTGKAGTGKSTVLKPVVEAYKKSGFTVIGAAFQGKVADQLSNELSIEGYTLDQLNNRWRAQDKFKNLIENKELKGQALAKAKSEVERLQEWRLTDKHVVILDEGSMVHGTLWNSLLQEIERSRAQLRIVQDNKQIKALHGLDAARLVEEKVGAYEIKGVVRQFESWMREASALLNEHRIEEGLKPYYERGHFDFRERDFEAKISLVADYLEGIKKAPHQTHMALAQKNKDIVELNELIRGALMSQGKLGDEFIFGREGEGILDLQHPTLGPKTHHFRKSAYGRRFAVGDRVMFLENDHKGWHVKTLESGNTERVGVKNGTLGIIEGFNLKRQTVEVRLHDGRLVGFDSKAYESLTHGYAVTINKSQGATFDHSYGFFSSFNSNQLLIWLTRHKQTFKGYVSKGIATDLKGMVSHVARSDYKGLSTDYDLSKHQKPYFNLVQHYWGISREAGNLLTQIETLTSQSEKEGKEVSLTPQWEQYKSLIEERNQGAKDILKNWSQCSPFIHQTGVRRETLEVQADLRKRLLSVAEEAALDKVEVYCKVSNHARTLWKELSKTHPGALSHSHPEYERYAKVKAERNELAYEIASFPMLYKSFFKIREQGGSFVTYRGDVYQQKSQGFKVVQVQAEQYIKERRAEAYETTLKFDERAYYNQVLEYKNLHHQSVAAFSHLKEMRNTAVVSAILETQQLKNQKIAYRRDKLAYEIVSHYGNTQPFIEKLGLKDEILLKHAVFGEVRNMIEAYKAADVIEERTHLADRLVSFTLKEQGSVDKSLYSLLKEQNLDVQKLKFEQGWLKAHQEGKHLSIKNIDELEAAYKDLSSYREDKKALSQWDILKIESVKYPNSGETKLRNKLERQRNDYPETIRIKDRAVNTYDREEVTSCLTASHIEGIFARHIEGWVSTPKSYHRPYEIRYGQYKEFWINRKNGAWYNFAAGEGGDIFKYVSKSQNISYGEAIKLVGTEINAPQHLKMNLTDRSQRQNQLRLQAELEERVRIEKSQEKANKLYETSSSIQGTIAERYLREHRKIETAELP